MCTVGYGDISPITNIEKVFCMLIVLIGCGVYAYAINTIGQIFQDIEKKRADFK
jgi:hypothetical protein